MIFDKNIMVSNTAYLNWRIDINNHPHNLAVLAGGYLRSSLLLLKECLENNNDKKADIVIFPILNNANHGIEIFLKSINWSLNILLGHNHTIEGGHDLLLLMNMISKKIFDIEGKTGLDYFNSGATDLNRYLKDLYVLINATQKQPNINFSRYPIDRKGNNHFYIENASNVMVDLELSYTLFCSIMEFLDDRALYYYS